MNEQKSSTEAAATTTETAAPKAAAKQEKEVAPIKPAKKNETTKEFRRNGEIHAVPLSSIVIDPTFNVRGENNFGDLTEMVESLKRNGQIEPNIAVKRDGKVVLVTGHRRFASLHIIAKTQREEPEMRIIFKKDGDPLELLTLQYTENLKVVNTPYEQALIIKRMEDLKAKREDIQQRLSISQAKFYALKKLLTMPEEVKNYVSTGKLSATTAKSIYDAVQGDTERLKEEVEKAVKDAESKGKKKATAANAEVGKTRTTTSILKEHIAALEEKAENDKLTKNEQNALTLFKAVFDKNSKRTINEKIRDMK